MEFESYSNIIYRNELATRVMRMIRSDDAVERERQISWLRRVAIITQALCSSFIVIFLQRLAVTPSYLHTYYELYVLHEY